MNDPTGLNANVVARPRWYALQTKPRHEKKVNAHLKMREITSFLPMMEEVHHWSDRQQLIQVPIFPCYLFFQAMALPEIYHLVACTSGVLRIVGVRGEAAPIDDAEMEGIQRLLLHPVPFALSPFIKVGQRVRIRGGCLDGVEGILAGEHNLALSIQLIQQSIVLRIDGYRVEPVATERFASHHSSDSTIAHRL